MSRSLQGFARTLLGVPSMSLIAILEPEERIRYVGYLEASINIGIGVGPVLGSLLFELVGFIYLFLIFGLLHLFYIPLMVLVMPENVDSDSPDTKSLVKDSENIQSEGTRTSSDISLMKILTNPSIIIYSIAEFICYMSF